MVSLTPFLLNKINYNSPHIDLIIGGIFMTDPKQTVPFEQNDNKSTDTKQLSDTWPDDALADLADYIEEQGVYIRQ